jgi:adenosine deaminase
VEALDVSRLASEYFCLLGTCFSPHLALSFRIGHGFLSIHSDGVVELLKTKNVLLEICPISNYLTNSVETMESHPIRRLMEAGKFVDYIWN